MWQKTEPFALPAALQARVMDALQALFGPAEYMSALLLY